MEDITRRREDMNLSCFRVVKTIFHARGKRVGKILIVLTRTRKKHKF